MKPTNKIVPVVALAVLMGLSGAMIATAQGLEAQSTTATTDEVITPVHARRGDREHGPRGEGGHAMFRTMFTAADADADGSVTAEELAAFRAAKVAAADANADGALSLDEFQTVWLEAMQPRMVDAFQHLDADGDASITAAEVDDLVANVMDRMDRNGDGVINADDRGRRGRRGSDE
jgi:EF hand